MRNVALAIIGTGQIGSRHLQSIARLDRNADVYLVDPFRESLNTAFDRYNQVSDESRDKFPKNIVLLEKIGDLPRNLDLVVIATTAQNRLQIIGSLMDHCTVKNLILEKIVFQRPEDFDTAESLFKKSGVKVWVNCPRRLWPGYIRIRELISRTRLTETSMIVTGAKWGLCCNSIHYLDLFGYMTGIFDPELQDDLLDLHLVPAKRPGTIEMSGAVCGFTKSGGAILIREYPDADMPVHVVFENPDIRCTIDEQAGTIKISRSSDAWKPEEMPLEMVLQSQLTHRCIAEILDTGKTKLPTFAESAVSHKLLLSLFMHHLSIIKNEEVSLCPIT